MRILRYKDVNSGSGEIRSMLSSLMWSRRMYRLHVVQRQGLGAGRWRTCPLPWPGSSLVLQAYGFRGEPSEPNTYGAGLGQGFLIRTPARVDPQCVVDGRRVKRQLGYQSVADTDS